VGAVVGTVLLEDRASRPRPGVVSCCPGPRRLPDPLGRTPLPHRLLPGPRESRAAVSG